VIAREPPLSSPARGNGLARDADTFTRSLVMSKGNKVRKKEVKKPKQDKKNAAKK